MFKWLLTVLFLGAGFCCFSGERPQGVCEASLHNESLALVYIARGNENLTCHYDALALDDFNKAASLLEEVAFRSVELDFLIYFGKVIAYNNLGMQNECQNALTALFFLVEGEEDEGDVESDFFEDYPAQKYEEADGILRQLAGLARSPKVRDLLFSLIDKMSEQVLPTFKFADPLTMQLGWRYDDNDNVSSDLCKSSVWKKLEKVTKKTYKVIMKAKQVWDFLKEVGEKLNQG